MAQLDVGGGLMKGAHALAAGVTGAWDRSVAKFGIGGTRLIASVLAASTLVGGATLLSNPLEYAGAICPPGLNIAGATVSAADKSDSGGKSDTGGSGDGTVPNANALATAKRVYAVFGGMGMNKENVAGILGNWERESGGNLDPSAAQAGNSDPDNDVMLGRVGTGGNAIGIGQWDAGRATGLVKFAKSKGKSWTDLDTQLAYALVGDGANGDIIRDMVKNPKASPKEAAVWFNDKWERSGDTHGSDGEAKRIRYAETWFSQMGDWTADKDAADDITGGAMGDIVAGGTESGSSDTGSDAGDATPAVTVSPAVLAKCCVGVGAATATAAGLEGSDTGTGDKTDSGSGSEGGAASSSATLDQFLEKYGKDLNTIAEKYNVPAIAMIAMAGQESSYGTAGMAVKANNPWNYSATGVLEGLPGYQGAGDSNSDFTIATWDTIPNAANGWGMFLAAQSLYADAFNHATDPAAFIDALRDAGYCGQRDGYAEAIIALFPTVKAAAEKAGLDLFVPSANGNPVGDSLGSSGSTGGTTDSGSSDTDGSTTTASDASTTMCGVNAKNAGYAQGSLESITEDCVSDPKVLETAKKLKGLPSDIMTSAANFAIGTACNNNIGYDQGHVNPSNPQLTLDSPTTQEKQMTDCGYFVSYAMNAAGFGDGTKSSFFFEPAGHIVDTLLGGRPDFQRTTVDQVQPGDIVVNGTDHVVLYLGEGLEVAAHIGENGCVSGCVLGDGDKSEVSVAYFSPSSFTHVWRYTGSAEAKRWYGPAKQAGGTQGDKATGTHNGDSGNAYAAANCTWYAYDRRKQMGIGTPSYLGDGGDWNDSAPKYGLKVDHTPQVGAAMVFERGQDGASAEHGHVAVVESVHSDGSFDISEMGNGVIYHRSFPASAASTHTFVH